MVVELIRVRLGNAPAWTNITPEEDGLNCQCSRLPGRALLLVARHVMGREFRKGLSFCYSAGIDRNLEARDVIPS